MTQETFNHEQLNDWRWQIIAVKNKEFDGAFYTGVRTTKIYCKPSCPAKTPKRENVSFFASCDEAEKNGFRACLRCQPRNANFINPNVELVLQAFELFAASSDEALLLETIGEKLNVSAAHLQRAFKIVLGVSPKEFAAARRLENFKRQVRDTDVTTALYESGFNSSRALYEKASETLGMTPAQYKRGGKDLQIKYTIVDSCLGKMLVAATQKGVCKISFGANENELTTDLEQEYPAARIEFDRENVLNNHVEAILQNLAGKSESFDLPLDVRATAFQLRVWQELRKIPRGETRSYKQIAQAIEQPTAVRAVARACAGNPVALITPCHRVVGSDGKLSGYRWGVERKEQLLAAEKNKL